MICKGNLPEVATESVNKVARWLSQKYRTLTMSMLVAQNIELVTLALSGITIILIPDKGPKHRTVRLNTGHLATLNMKYIHHVNRPSYLTTWMRHCAHVYLTLNPRKCVFANAELDILGYHITLKVIQPRIQIVEAVLKFPRPRNRKQVQSLLGIAVEYYK